MSRLITSNGSQLLLFPSSFDCWLPQDHNVRFFDELIEEMDLSGIAKTIDLNQKRGRPAYDRVMMTKIVLYGYTVGIASARELEKACVERLDLRFLTGNRCPKYRGIARFKRQNLKALAGLHEQVLLIAAEEGLIEMKEVAIDGTKMLADASKHKAMSYQYMCNRELELKSEIKALTNEKNTGSRAKRREISDEIEFRKGRLNHIRKWKQALMDRVRDEGREEPEPKEQINFTDDESRIMRVEKQFEQAYNAQAAVDKRSQIILVALVTQDHNDKQLLETMLDRVAGTRLSTISGLLRETKQEFYRLLTDESEINYFGEPARHGTAPAPKEFNPKRKFDAILLKRLAIAGLVITELSDDKNLGRTKLAKIFYLADVHTGLKLDTNYARDAAGPFDDRAWFNTSVGVEPLALRHGYFDSIQDSSGVTYVPAANLTKLNQKVREVLGSKFDAVVRIIELLRPLDTQQSEIIATLYACWNDLLLENRRATDPWIIHEFRDKWHEKKKRFGKPRLEKALNWMRENGLVPSGTGCHTVLD